MNDAGFDSYADSYDRTLAEGLAVSERVANTSPKVASIGWRGAYAAWAWCRLW